MIAFGIRISIYEFGGNTNIPSTILGIFVFIKLVAPGEKSVHDILEEFEAWSTFAD